MINLHPDYPIIYSVQSVLISEQQPTKLFTDFKNLVQSHHVTDNMAFFFNPPSPYVLAKLNKINPKDPISLGTDSNSNLKAIVLVALQNAFSSKEEAKQSFIIDKIANQNSESIQIKNIKNHNHQCLQSENTLKLVSSFLKNLSARRQQKIETFSLKKQLQDLPIILDYLIIICRAILYKFRIQNAQDYSKFVKDTHAFSILSNYFGIKFIQNESFYLFEDEKLFIYKGFDQYVTGWYSLGDSQPSYNMVSHLRNKSEANNLNKKYNNSEIMECSRQEGSNLVSSRHADEFSRSLAKEQGNLITKRKSGKDPLTQKVKSLELDFNHSAVKQFESKIQDFQVNLYSEQKGKLFNNSYRNSKNKEQSIESNKQKTKRQNILQKPLHIDKMIAKAHPFHGIQNPRLQAYKRIQCDSNYLQTILPIPKKERSESLGDRSLRIKYKGLTDKQNKPKKKSSDCLLHDNFLQWQNQDRPRRVQTICYKTCQTCHRRFYRNQLQSNVFQIKICVKSKTKQSKNIQNQPSTQLFFKNTPEFLNKKNKKKLLNESNVQTPMVKDNLIALNSLLKERQKINSERVIQFNWLNKRNKFENVQDFEKRQSPCPLVGQSASPRQSNMKKHLEPKSGQQMSKKVLSIKRLILHHKQGQKSAQKNVIVPIKVNQDRKFSSDTQELGRKARSFFTLKSATELQKIEQIEKLGQIREKSANQRQSKKVGKFLQTINASSRKGNLLMNNNNQKSRSDETKKRDEALISVLKDKSPDKWLPRFIKKDSVNLELNTIINK